MTNFEIRKQKANILMDELIKILDEKNIPYFISGYEYLISKNNAKDKIIKLHDNTSEFVRFYPDMTLIINNNTLLAEVKNSTGIEKNCFNNYLSLSENLGVNVVLFLKNRSFCNLTDIVFSKMNEYDFISKINIPVTNSIWREPRLLEKEKYFEYLNAYKMAGKYTSGCSFAFIDFNKTTFFSLEELINRL